MTSDQVRVRRKPERGRYDRADIDAVLDAAVVAHVAFVDRGQPFCMPFLHARAADVVHLHGSTGSRALRTLAAGAPACLTVTILDGLVLAGSVFDHSANYRSVVLLGRCTELAADQRLDALRALTERLAPGRWDEVRPPTRQELAATTVLAMPIDQASVKFRSGPPTPDDSPDAVDGVWTGVLPVLSGYGEPQPAPGVAPGLPLPASVRSLVS